MKHSIFLIFGIAAALSILGSGNLAQAQTIPGSADAGRIQTKPEDILTPRPAPPVVIPQGLSPEAFAPEGADDLTFILQNVVIEGMTAFSEEAMSDIYAPFIGESISLSRAWGFAQAVTEQYQREGYFLSRAYVPAQEIGEGIITLRVVEGYFGEVLVEGAHADHYLVQALTQRITAQKPARFKDLESVTLLLSDIPGQSFQSVLGRMDGDAPEGAIRLTLKENSASGRGRVLFNNHSSRFTGPHNASFAYEDSFVTGHSTAFSGGASIPGGNELWTASASHNIKILPEVGLEFSVGLTDSEPGFTLTPNKIESRSLNWGFEVNWQAIRQRQQNLKIGLALQARNVNTDILDTELTRDRIRSVKLTSAYDGNDPLGGYNTINATLTRGIAGLGANNPDEPNLSRADAEPDFTKIEATWQRSQFIADGWLGIATLAGQRASKALYSSEEFGFGGASLGRGYDASEITGDNGVSASIEVQYTRVTPVKNFKITPLAFYDIGKIWNIDQGQADGLSIASLGIGGSISHPSGLSASLTIAQPLTKTVDTPTYGSNGRNPRIYFQLGRRF